MTKPLAERLGELGFENYDSETGLAHVINPDKTFCLWTKNGIIETLLDRIDLLSGTMQIIQEITDLSPSPESQRVNGWTRKALAAVTKQEKGKG